MTRKSTRLDLIAFFILPAADGYQGKPIRFTVGFLAGGGCAAHARPLAKCISRHIPGFPSPVEIRSFIEEVYSTPIEVEKRLDFTVARRGKS